MLGREELEGHSAGNVGGMKGKDGWEGGLGGRTREKAWVGRVKRRIRGRC